MTGLKDNLISRAVEEGFDLARVCRPWDVPHVPGRLSAFLDKESYSIPRGTRPLASLMV